MGEVFVSYKAEDRARIAPLIAALEAEGISVWWDQQINVGSNWRREIERHLDAAGCVIVAWSQLSVGPEGEFVRDEATRARRAGQYVPIRIDEIQPPLGFGETQVITLSGWTGKRADPRFQALLHAVKAKLAGEAVEEDLATAKLGVATATTQPMISRRAVIVGTSVAGLTLAGGAGWYLLGGTAQAATRIAVLPFRNMSGDEVEDYFAEGLAEELRGALSRAGLQVIGRNSSEAVAEADVPTIVDKLNVSHILTGSVRKSSENIRVSAQLVAGRDGVESWAQNYDSPPGEAIALQTDIATQVAQALSIALSAELEHAISLGGTSDPVAQDLLNQVRADLRKRGIGEETVSSGIARLEAALQRDDHFAGAWVVLGRLRSVWASDFIVKPEESARQLTQAEREIRRGLAIAPALGFGFVALAGIDSRELRYRACLEKTRKAVAIASNDPQVLASATNYLPWIGTLAEAEHITDQLLSLDPLNPTTWLARSQMFLASRRFEEAAAAGRKGLELSPEHDTSLHMIALALAAMGRYDEAVATIDEHPSLEFWADVLRAIRRYREGDVAKGERDLAAIKAVYGDKFSYHYCQIYAQAGLIEEAFVALDTATRIKASRLIFTMRDPMLTPLSDDPRFRALLKRLDFPIIDTPFA